MTISFRGKFRTDNAAHIFLYAFIEKLLSFYNHKYIFIGLDCDVIISICKGDLSVTCHSDSREVLDIFGKCVNESKKKNNLKMMHAKKQVQTKQAYFNGEEHIDVKNLKMTMEKKTECKQEILAYYKEAFLQLFIQNNEHIVYVGSIWHNSSVYLQFAATKGTISQSQIIKAAHSVAKEIEESTFDHKLSFRMNKRKSKIHTLLDSLVFEV